MVTVAHGTRDPVGNEVARRIAAAAGERAGLSATSAYVELCEPLLEDVAAGLVGPAVVVPLLLSTGHHVRVDLPAAVARASVPVRLLGALGPHPALAAAQVDRLRAAGAEPGGRVVLVAAGSNDPLATPDIEGAAALLGTAWGGEVVVATMGGLGERPGAVVRAGDAVSPYLLAPGHFADRVREACAAATVVADVIGAHEQVIDLVARRAGG